MRMLRTAMATAAAVLAFTAAGIGSAHADPPFLPPDNSLVAVGDETTQYVADALSANYNVTNPVNPFYSWDAVGPPVIQTKADANPSPCTIPRPNGSVPGILKLIGTATNNRVPGQLYGYGCVDMVMSSRSLNANDPTWLTSVIFARDLNTWSTGAGGNAVANLTDQELQAIYSCDATRLPAGDTQHTGAVMWRDLNLEGGVSTDAIVPVLPQAASGLRAQWLAELGLNVFGACVVNGTWNGKNIEENDGTNAVFTPAGAPAEWRDIVFPYSGGMYVCQVYTKRCPDLHGALVLRNISGRAPLILVNPPVLNIAGFPANHIQGLFAVVRNGGSQAAPLVATPITPGARWPVNLSAFLGQRNGFGWICTAAAQNLVAGYGFAKTGALCGALLNSTATPLPAPPIP